MYDLRIDRRLTKKLFSNWDKEIKDWVVNAIASIVVVDQVVEFHERIALEEAIDLLDSRDEIENMLEMVRKKKMLKIENIKMPLFKAGEIFIYLTAIATIDGRLKKNRSRFIKKNR